MSSEEPAVIEIDETIAGTGEEAIPNCSAEIFSEASLAAETTFDNDNGSIFLYGGDGCAEQTITAFKARGKNMKTKQDRFYEKQAENQKKGGKPESREKPTAADADEEFPVEEIEKLNKFETQQALIEDYTDGYTMVSGWTWGTGELTRGEMAGLCIADPADVPEGGVANYATCWTLSRRGNAGRKVDFTSFSIDQSLLNADIDLAALLGSSGEVTNDLYPGFFGSWFCGKIDKRKGNEDSGERVTCTRYLPKGDKSNQKDYRYASGPVNVYTYLSSRDAAEESNGRMRLLMEEEAAAPTVEAMGPLELYKIELQGAVSNLAFAGLSLGLSMLALGA